MELDLIFSFGQSNMKWSSSFKIFVENQFPNFHIKLFPLEESLYMHGLNQHV